MKITFLTIFPKIFDCYLNESILKRAQKKGLVKFGIVNIRDFTADKHKSVDDKPYGGGPGMILKIGPIYRALRSILKKSEIRNLVPTSVGISASLRKSETNPKFKFQKSKTRIILLSAKGKTFDQKMAGKFSKYKHLIFICGRYEGVDERVAKHLADEEISIGNYVLTGGELPAMIISDAITRLMPGVIKTESLKEESFAIRPKNKLKIKNLKLKIVCEYPQYTRPEKFLNWQVPAILLSGDHKKISDWRKRHSRTKIQKQGERI